jgi:hypothetical protein
MNHGALSTESNRLNALTWLHWQRSVVDLLRADFASMFEFLGMDEVDWVSWRPLYEEGRSPRSAIDRALARS